MKRTLLWRAIVVGYNLFEEVGHAVAVSRDESLHRTGFRVASATLDLQQILDRIYDAAGYQYYIYQGPPEPNLSPAQMEWAQSFVPQLG